MEDVHVPAAELVPTFALVRVLGNDLPPRHPLGQTRRNLREILDREPDLPGCERRWVVNRIVDPDEEAAIIALLEERGEPYLLRPLARDGSDLPGWAWDAVVEGEPTYLAPIDPAERGRDPRLRRLYDRRVRALIDINGARNAAIDEGRQRATWVLPWDGGCLLTRDAYDELVTTVSRDPELRYLAVPMARIADLAALDDPHLRPRPEQEHMLAFHRDATERFDPRLTYGVREKVALLRRLGVPGPWDDWRWPPRSGAPGASPEADRVAVAGWVARLPVGDEAQETDPKLRWRARATAVLDLIDRYDALVARAHREDPDAPLLTEIELTTAIATTPDEGHPAERFHRLATTVRDGDDGSSPATARALLDGAQDGDLTGLVGRVDEAAATSGSGVPPAVLVDEGLRLLAAAGARHAAAEAALIRWAEARAAWHDAGHDPRRARADHRGTWSDVERAVVALRLDDVAGALTALRTTQERLLAQLGPDSEPVVTDPSAVAAQFLAWQAAAAIGRHLGLDVWQADVAGRSIARAATRREPPASEPVGAEDRRSTYDVVIATDPRLVGGGNKSIAEEVRAHAAVGYTTGIYPLYGSKPGTVGLDRSIEELLDEGLATLLMPGEPVDARLLLVRGPSLVTHEQPRRPRIRAERRLLVVNAVHREDTGTVMYYEPQRLPEYLRGQFGGDWEIAAISSVVARELAELAPGLPVLPDHWANVIDVDAWSVTRDLDAVPLVVGRHGRDNPVKWPADAEALRLHLPVEGPRVVLLGGASVPERLLGTLPPTWTVYRFDEVPVRRFLAMLHVFTYQHHPTWVEAFGRTVLEALASGAAAVLPAYLRETFGDGPLYVDDPAEQPELYRRLDEDRGLLRAVAAAGQRTVRERFGHEHHRHRLEALIGPPRAASAGSGFRHVPAALPGGRGRGATDRTRSAGPRRAVLAPVRPPEDAPPRVLFVTDNGHGVGHLTRLLAIARQARGRFTPVFLTLSEAYPVLRELGYPAEYLPSAVRLGMKRADWQVLVRPRLVKGLWRLQPRLVVVDHVGPPDALLEARRRTRGMELIWSRRGLWREGRNRPRLALADAFDMIIEPGDLAAPIDRGATATRRRGVTAVPPITVIGVDELEDRASAQAALGLPPEGRAVLIQLSDSDPARLTALIRQAAAVVRDIAGAEPVHLFAPQHVLHRDALGPIDGVHLRAVYPLARYLRAFDGVISTAGYNSYHEVVMSGVPAVFVARDSTSLDDQRRRAEYASLCGRAGFAETIGAPGFRDAVARMLRPVEPEAAAAVTAELGPMDGGVVVADLLAERAQALTNRPFVVPPGLPPAPGVVAARRTIRSGQLLPPLAADGARCVGIVALDHDPDGLVELTGEMARIQTRRPTFKPIFLVSSEADPAVLDAGGFAFETVLQREEWTSLATGIRYEDYLRGRLSELGEVYAPEAVLSPHPGRPVDEWLLP
jgi:glycosyltransferase involved in cell wall biosynthesis